MTNDFEIRSALDLATDGKRFLIGNNRGGINGWVGHHCIYGIATEVETCALLEPGIDIATLPAQPILHIGLRLARCAAECKRGVDEVPGQVLQGPEIRQLLLRTGAEEQHQLAPLKLARCAQAPAPLGHRAHRRTAGAGADHHDVRSRMIRHQERSAEGAGDLEEQRAVDYEAASAAR